LRKNPCIWAKWSTGNGMSLHPLQLQIAMRGVQLLKAGGLLVYSTCSMSPYGSTHIAFAVRGFKCLICVFGCVENEAVVAELLRNSNGTLELVDAREQFLPLFKARPGLR
jgi:16S rRNA C967 or C1407 C5-methylase (RsmB/RsmF family)